MNLILQKRIQFWCFGCFSTHNFEKEARYIAPAIFGHVITVGKKLLVINKNLLNTQHLQY